MRVALVALGHSCTNYLELAIGRGGRKGLYDETWVVNGAGDVLIADRIFHMDDVRIQEKRAEAGNIKVKNMLAWMRGHPGPIYTSRTHPDYPGLVEYPLEDVVNTLGSNYFNNTVPYAIAYAAFLGTVTELGLFGVDYTYPNMQEAERGRACCEYWIRACQERGITVSAALGSTIMDGFKGMPYGYDTLDLNWEAIDNKYKITMTPKEVIPTAEEIERRYDSYSLFKERTAQ